jgi:hypothetical protein
MWWNIANKKELKKKNVTKKTKTKIIHKKPSHSMHMCGLRQKSNALSHFLHFG